MHKLTAHCLASAPFRGAGRSSISDTWICELLDFWPDLAFGSCSGIMPACKGSGLSNPFALNKESFE